MAIFYLSASSQTNRFRSPARWVVASFSVALLFFSLLGLTTPVSGAQKHGCAPDVPPPVAGTPVPAQALPDIVLINEVLSQPASNWNCSEPASVFSAAKDSWIELYNPQNQALDLYAAHTQISLNGGSNSSLLPFGSAIAAGGFLVIFPLEKQTVAAPANWNIILSIDGIIIDQAAIPLLQPDQAYARVPDGSTTWLYAGNPTIDASNNSTAQPVVPTPTPTKTPQATKTPGATEVTGSTGTDQPASFGTQPAWSQVQFPQDATPTPAETPTIKPALQQSGPPQNPPGPTNNGPNGWLIAAFSLFALLVPATLIWRWRRLRRH